MNFSQLVLFGLFIALCVTWWRGHSGYWKILSSTYGTKTRRIKAIFPIGKSAGPCHFRKPEGSWIRNNTCGIYISRDEMIISSGMFNFLFPEVAVPWRCVSIKETKKIGLFLKLIVVFEGCPGEFAISLGQKNLVESHVGGIA